MLRARRPWGLRARLTILYALFFALLVIGLGWLFRQTLRNILQRDAETMVAEEWAAAKGYLDIRDGKVGWAYDRNDPEVARAVQTAQTVFLLADENGAALQQSDAFRALGVSADDLRAWLTATAPRDRVRRDRLGVLYLIRSGTHVAQNRKYLFAVGRSLEANERVLAEFTRTYFAGIPILVLAVAALGWFMAGRALAPLNQVAQAARSLSSENLRVRLRRRGAGDELDDLIDAFNSMANRLENSFTQVRQFSMDASHELRTPLTAIRSQLEVALITATSQDQFREAIHTAIEDVDQLSHVVKALMQLAQAESGQVTIAREPVDLRELTSKVVEQFQLPAEAQELQLDTSLSESEIIGDRVQLQRMISNLLSNALKYTPRGGRVSVELHSTAGGVNLVVADTGRGIPADHLPHIFDRFYRVPEANRSPERGLGLGLSFVNWIARVHSGRIEVESEPGRGSRFTAIFPAERARPPEAPAPPDM